MVDLLILGSGVAGLAAAVQAAARGIDVVLCTKGALQSSATRYAQGGVAAAVSSEDSAALHARDTLRAGAGLCDPEAVAVLVSEGPERVRELMELGAAFDRDPAMVEHGFALGREGGHSVHRIVHAGGDATGAEIERALVAAVRATAAGVHEQVFVADLIVEHGRVSGALAFGDDGVPREFRARHTLLATGGAGQCFAVTTNPQLSTGDGIAMAARAGAALADLEFMQFHPTALDQPSMPRPLLSEALRGEGAILRDDHGVAFMAAVHPMADLAPRDVVARACVARMREGSTARVWLDATAIADFPTRFPTVFAACREAGLDPRVEWLPVAPAAHYLSGGVATDLDGATSLPGLWACGEVACSGVHGANRLASNSLLDGLVFGPRAVAAIADGKAGPDTTGVLRALPTLPVGQPAVVATSSEPVTPTIEHREVSEARRLVQRTMTDHAGVLRDASGLAMAQSTLQRIDDEMTDTMRFDVASEELGNIVDVSERLVRAASLRDESRGTHTRVDAPDEGPAFLGRFFHVGKTCTFAPLFDEEFS